MEERKQGHIQDDEEDTCNCPWGKIAVFFAMVVAMANAIGFIFVPYTHQDTFAVCTDPMSFTPWAWIMAGIFYAFMGIIWFSLKYIFMSKVGYYVLRGTEYLLELLLIGWSAIGARIAFSCQDVNIGSMTADIMSIYSNILIVLTIVMFFVLGVRAIWHKHTDGSVKHIPLLSVNAQ